MNQPLFGILIIFILFALSLCFALAINLLRYKRPSKSSKKTQTPPKSETKIYYIENYRKPKKNKKKPVTIPLEATVLKPEEFKKIIDEGN